MNTSTWRSMSVMAERRGPGFLAKSLALARKDLRIEARSKETLPPMVAFSLAVALLLAFTLGGARISDAMPRSAGGASPLVTVLAGFMWLTTLFAGLIAFARSFEIERADDALDSLLLAPLDRSGVFLSKALSNLVYVLLVQAILVPVFVVLFEPDVGGSWPALLLVIVLVDVGFVSVGTLLASLASQTKSRELMLPVLALPALVPAFIAAVELTGDLFAGRQLDAVATRGWFGILIAFDIVFATIGALAFEFALD